ncbi:hypothetical protein TorRG33x02_203030 [Trema orientale]|uniref:Uncharacterized protein n=1 Tax=Trema orientale TaxID=63057 RepID=A0A2P5EEN5_TREOI|nr:hypothetical protein TorRG33x02_203030 [Trema orientale]
MQFFQRKASQRKTKNSILYIDDEDDRWRDKVNEITTVVEDYFPNIFTSSHSTVIDWEAVLETVQERVDGGINQQLMKESTEEEIKTTLFTN